MLVWDTSSRTYILIHKAEKQCKRGCNCCKLHQSRSWCNTCILFFIFKWNAVEFTISQSVHAHPTMEFIYALSHDRAMRREKAIPWSPWPSLLDWWGTHQPLQIPSSRANPADRGGGAYTAEEDEEGARHPHPHTGFGGTQNTCQRLFPTGNWRNCREVFS